MTTEMMVMTVSAAIDPVKEIMREVFIANRPVVRGMMR